MPEFVAPCGHAAGTQVLRTMQTARSIRRQRECLACEFRFWTAERYGQPISTALLPVAIDPCAADAKTPRIHERDMRGLIVGSAAGDTAMQALAKAALSPES